MLSRSGIYKITCTANGRFYIGSAVKFKARWSYHRRDARAGHHSSRHLQRAWNKYGESAFKFEVLMVCSKEDLIMYEQRAIDALHPEFNMSPTAGSVIGCKHSEDARKANSVRSKKRWSDPAARAEQSERTKKTMSDPAIKARIFEAWKAKQDTVSSEERRARYTLEVRKKMAAASKYHIAETAKKVSASLRKKAKKYVVLGDALCMAEITEKYGISRCLFKARIKQGWDVETAASKPQRPGVMYQLNGGSYSANELAKMSGCTASAFRKRIVRGMCVEDAVKGYPQNGL